MPARHGSGHEQRAVVAGAFGERDQTTTSVTLRMNRTLSPYLSLQAYAQPFIAAGRYSDFKDVLNPHADAFTDRFVWVNHADGYSFATPHFDLQQLRSTVVFRWEYRPGSTLLAIWNHGQTNTFDDGRYQLHRDLLGVANSRAENIVMVKANYWIGL